VKSKLIRILTVTGVAVALIAGETIWYLHRLAPKPIVRVHLRSVEAQLTEIDLVNNGDADAQSTAQVTVTWDGPTAPTFSALSSYEGAIGAGNTLVFRLGASAPQGILHPGQPLAIGWIRLGAGDSNLLAQITGG
jgi:hypothetical protein